MIKFQVNDNNNKISFKDDFEPLLKGKYQVQKGAISVYRIT